MNPESQEMLPAAQEIVTCLVERCAKTGPLYPANPKAVAQVSRTGKWLINAIVALDRALEAPCGQASK